MSKYFIKILPIFEGQTHDANRPKTLKIFANFKFKIAKQNWESKKFKLDSFKF